MLFPLTQASEARRKTCRQRMKEWPRIKIRSGAIKKRCLKKKLKIMSTCLKKLKRSALGKSFFRGSVQSDGERRKEKYLAGTVFHILGM